MGIGNKSYSIELLKKVLKINKKHSMSYYSLSRLIDLDEETKVKEDIINFDLNIYKDNYNKYNILFSKSHIHHRLKNYEKSAENLIKANDLKLKDKPSNIKKVITLSNNIKNITSADNSYNLYNFNYPFFSKLL